MRNICDYLKSKSYPGRGIYVSKSPDNNYFWCTYWIMGRSEGSRNRVFFEIEDDENYDGIELPNQGVCADVADWNKTDVANPWLLYYNPLIYMPKRNVLILANGDQSTTIFEKINELDDCEKGFYEGLLSREYEHDAPNYTPRISAIINSKTRSFDFSILKREGEDFNYCVRNFYHYDDDIPPCEGRLITTYVDDGEPLPTFNSDPLPLKHKSSSIKHFKDSIWNALNADNKISLLVSEVSFETGHVKWDIINRYEKVETLNE